MHCRQQYRRSPWSRASHPLNLTLQPSEEPIFSYLNTELPQQTTHPSSRGEILGWGWHGDMETAGTTEFRRHTQEPGPDWFRNLTPENSYPTTAVDIFVYFRVAWG